MIYFIVNTTAKSGKGKEVWRKVKKQLNRYSMRYKAFETRYKGHATWLARKISELEGDYINLVVIGGDGTVNEAINGIENFKKIRFAVIPAGSGNDFARGMGLGKNIEKITNDILDIVIYNARTDRPIFKAIDLGQVFWEGCEAPRKFVISSGVGLDAIVCKKALSSKLKVFLNGLQMGKLTYIILTVQTLFSMDTFDGAVEVDGVKRNYRDIIFSAIMNFRAEGGGVPMAPKAKATDGKFSICCVSGIPKWRTFFCLPFLILAKQKYIKEFELFDCREYSVKLSKPVVLHTDGEYVADTESLTFKCLPHRLKVINNII